MPLIDADALQRKICGAKCGCEYEDCGNEGDCKFAHFIFGAPTVDAEPVVHGKWIDASGKKGVNIGMKCSLCGARIKNSEYFNGNHKYCHKCGARMDGDKQ